MKNDNPRNGLLRFYDSRIGKVLARGAGIGAGLALFFFPAATWSVGFRLPNQDPEAIARGNAFAATADNPAAIYYNPAGITQLEGHNASLGLYFISTGVKYESFTGADAETDDGFQAVPQLHYVYSPTNSPLSFGLGMYVPYGLGLDWGKDTSFRTLAQEGDLLYVTVNPVVAWQATDQISLAIGPTFNYSEVMFKRGIGFLPNDEFRVEGDDFAFGFNAGLMWKPYEQWSFGINYRLGTTMRYRGESEARPYSAETGTSAELEFPQFVVFGVSYRPTDDWNLEFNIDWTDWDTLNEVTFEGTAGGDQVFPFNYESSFMYEFGVTRYLPKGLFASAGYIYSENSSPSRDFNPIVPDSVLHLGSVGFGYRGPRWGIAAAYHFAYNSGRRISNSQSTSLIGETANGDYEVFNQAMTVSARLNF